jgi:hypothetical protein
LDPVEDLNPKLNQTMDYTPLNYYGIDYLAAIFAIIDMFFLGNKKRSGFLLYMVAISFGIVFAILAKSPPLIVTNVIMFGMNLRGFIKWKRGPQ